MHNWAEWGKSTTRGRCNGSAPNGNPPRRPAWFPARWTCTPWSKPLEKHKNLNVPLKLKRIQLCEICFFFSFFSCSGFNGALRVEKKRISSWSLVGSFIPVMKHEHVMILLDLSLTWQVGRRSNYLVRARLQAILRATLKDIVCRLVDLPRMENIVILRID